MLSCAIDTGAKKVAIGTYPRIGIAVYDYSDCFGGGDTVTKVKTLTEADGLGADQFGINYINAFAIAGGYLYISPYERALAYQQRIKLSDYTVENISIQNYATSTYRGAVYYSPYTDRIYNHSYNRQLVITTGASSTSPKSFGIHYDNLPGINSGGYVKGVVEDKNNRNHI
jgi:hypothetical protein